MADYPARMREADRTATGHEVLDKRDALFVPHSEAEWCLFDPLLAVIHARRAARAGDTRAHDHAVRHLRRSLSQITGPDCALGEALCPEAYYRSGLSDKAPWEANDNTPLAWTQAMLRLALSCLRT
jgi:phosphorylase kinase alpha/beta subunit